MGEFCKKFKLFCQHDLSVHRISLSLFCSTPTYVINNFLAPVLFIYFGLRPLFLDRVHIPSQAVASIQIGQVFSKTRAFCLFVGGGGPLGDQHVAC